MKIIARPVMALRINWHCWRVNVWSARQKRHESSAKAYQELAASARDYEAFSEYRRLRRSQQMLAEAAASTRLRHSWSLRVLVQKALELRDL